MNPSSPPRRAWAAWLPAVLWMALLFCVSTDLGGPRHTSRFLRPLLRWLVPGITENTLEHVHFCVRKSGHALGYAILAGLLAGLPITTGGSTIQRHCSSGLNAIALAAIALDGEIRQCQSVNVGAGVGDDLDDRPAAGYL